MGVEDFFNDLNSYWENSNNTGSGSFDYSSMTDVEGNEWTTYQSGSNTIEKYVPHQRINIQSVLDRIHLEERLCVEKEDYEGAAINRDKADRIQENSELLVKLYDLKERALKDSDYAFAIDIKQKIQNIINNK